MHQTKRLGSPHFLICTHEGQFFPNLWSAAVPDAPVPALLRAGDPAPAVATAAAAAATAVVPATLTSDAAEAANARAMTAYYEQGVTSKLQFDRVLCDVPCSGDGTLRKAPELWTKWNTRFPAGLHKLRSVGLWGPFPRFLVYLHAE